MSASQDPSEIHPEHDRPTPANIDDWSEEQIEAFNHAKETKLEAQARDNREQLTEEQEQALELLEEPEADRTATVELGQRTVTVKTYLSKEMEQRIHAIERVQDNPSEAVDDVIDVLTWVIEDDDYADEEVWRAFHDRYGTKNLLLRFTKVMEPYLDEVENDSVVQKFREGGQR